MDAQVDTRQLQLWDAAKRSYVPVDGPIPEEGYARGVALNGSRQWRIAKAERPLKPRFAVSRGYKSDRSVDTVQLEYLAWAKSKGLPSIAVYSTRPPRTETNKGQPTYTGERRYISPEEQFTVVCDETIAREGLE